MDLLSVRGKWHNKNEKLSSRDCFWHAICHVGEFACTSPVWPWLLKGAVSRHSSVLVLISLVLSLSLCKFYQIIYHLCIKLFYFNMFFNWSKALLPHCAHCVWIFVSPLRMKSVYFYLCVCVYVCVCVCMSLCHVCVCMQKTGRLCTSCSVCHKKPFAPSSWAGHFKLNQHMGSVALNWNKTFLT